MANPVSRMAAIISKRSPALTNSPFHVAWAKAARSTDP